MGLRQAFKDAKQDFILAGIDNTAEVLYSFVDMEMATYELRIRNAGDYYNRLQGLAGDNERVKKELSLREQRDMTKLQREMAEKQKRAKMNAILIDTAAAVGRTAAQLGFPAAIPFIAIALATGATQYGIASKTPTGYKDGVINLKGPGTGTSDSIRANLSRGESVITAKATAASPKTLKMIQARQLDDKVLARIASKSKGGDGGSYHFDDKGMIAASARIENAVKSSDIVKKGSMIYEVKKEKESLTTYIKSKTL
jgi:hypothetical protein